MYMMGRWHMSEYVHLCFCMCVCKCMPVCICVCVTQKAILSVHSHLLPWSKKGLLLFSAIHLGLLAYKLLEMPLSRPPKWPWQCWVTDLCICECSLLIESSPQAKNFKLDLEVLCFTKTCSVYCLLLYFE